MTASLAGNYRAPANIASFRKGGMQVLENRNVLLGFGNQPAFTEYASNGTILWDVRMGPVMTSYDRETADNYRSYKFNWTGTPYWGPKIAAGPRVGNWSQMMAPARKDGKWYEWANATMDSAYFSWNGATELKTWMLFAADHPLELDAMAALHTHVNKTGFETGVFVGTSNSTRYLRAVALDIHGTMMAATPILDIFTGVKYPRAKDVLMGEQQNWWDGNHDSRWDAAVAKALEETDTLAALKIEWDNMRLGDQRQRGGMGVAVLVLLALFGGLGWVGWRQLRGAFNRKYEKIRGSGLTEVEAGMGVKSERERLRDAEVVEGIDGREDERKRLWLMYGWRQ